MSENDKVEESMKCLNLSKNYLNKGNLQQSLNLAKKSYRIYPLSESKTLISELESKVNSTNGNFNDNSTSKATGHDINNNNDTLKNRKFNNDNDNNNNANEKSSTKGWTPAQATLVKRVRSCKPTSYYEILAVEKTCSDNDIKKAYRKVS